MSETDLISIKARSPTKEEASAIKAMYAGEATARQQHLSLKYICNVLCRSQDMLYVHNDPEQTAFLNGRAFVGNKLLKMINVPIGRLVLLDEDDNIIKNEAET